MTGHDAERGSASPETRSPLRVVLISTYDLGRQPFGLASPAAWLREAGFRVSSLDLAVRRLDDEAVREAGLIAIHLPMHTATRIATHLVPRLRKINPRAHLAFYGLYAPLNESLLRGLGADSIHGGEFEPALVDLARRLSDGDSGDRVADETVVSLEKLRFRVPDRSDLGDLDHYARLRVGETDERLVGYTEASRGCKHLCRHCPIVPVYDGAFRVVQRDVVLEDIDQQVAAGARHITFGDPDFFNGIGHALGVVRDLHDRFPTITYDVTIKVEHLLKHAEHLRTLRETGCLFVTSAVESIDDAVLERLDKGHTREDFAAVVRHCRAAGLTLHPTFVAFHPWISVDGYRDLLRAIADLGLVEQVAPIQLALRLLITAESRLLELPEVREIVGSYDREALVFPWRHPDPEVDELQKRVQALVEDATGGNRPRAEIFTAVCDLVGEGAGAVLAVSGTGQDRRVTVPYLTEPWYC
jgi:hypothetical protein